jgi:archaellum component FlaC
MGGHHPPPREVNDVSEQRPSNQHLAALLEELLAEVRELRKGHEQLAADVRKLAEASRV